MLGWIWANDAASNMGFKSSTFATLFGSVNDLGFLRSAAGLEHGFLIYLIELFLIDLKNQRLNNHSQERMETKWGGKDNNTKHKQETTQM